MSIHQEWIEEGEKYARAFNDILKYAQIHGWENWKGPDPVDTRTHLAQEVLSLLRDANKQDKVEQFRYLFPPSYAPFTQFLEASGQRIEQINFIDSDRAVFFADPSKGKRIPYLLDNDTVAPLETSITSIGKSPRNNVFAIANDASVITTQNWQGSQIKYFPRTRSLSADISQIIPSNDGMSVFLLSPQGIFVLSQDQDIRIFPDDNASDDIFLSMENIALSPDNNFLAIGDQDLQHTIIGKDGSIIATIGPQSSYPHFCLFSKDSTQFLSNSCHFYNGVTIAVDTLNLPGLTLEPFKESDSYKLIDDNMRVYQGVSTSSFYILGDAYGWIKAITKDGKLLWEHFIGSTITGMAVSDDETTLLVGSYSGMLHKLILDKGHRDNHTIGTGNNFEVFRLLIWQNEERVWKW
ncbi:MAG: hypothetical protein JST90_06265 [Bacteroidetes bacterium]|nr:hypothetical protein [Bacteroidota bacterium]